MYIFRGESRKVLYVGKARSLKKRLASYFTKGTDSSKTDALLRSFTEVETIPQLDDGVLQIVLARPDKHHGWRYAGRAGSLAEFVRDDDPGGARNALRQLRELPWFARNVAVKALILAEGLTPFENVGADD